MGGPRDGDEPSSTPDRHSLRAGVGLLLITCGLFLFLVGIGITLDYIYLQSHPVPPIAAFLLGIKYEAGGVFLVLVGFTLRRRYPLLPMFDS